MHLQDYIVHLRQVSQLKMYDFFQKKFLKVLKCYHITAKAALKFGSEVWVLKKRDKQRLQAAQMKFLRHLLGITKLDKEKNTSIRKKMGHRT